MLIEEKIYFLSCRGRRPRRPVANSRFCYKSAKWHILQPTKINAKNLILYHTGRRGRRPLQAIKYIFVLLPTFGLISILPLA